MRLTPLTIVYFGSARFAVPPLERLLARPDRFRMLAVASQPDKPAGRDGAPRASAVAQFARARGLTLLQPKTLKDPGVQKTIADLAPDFLVVAAYGKIIPRSLLDAPRLAPLNLHGSLLPKYRGASPIQAAILSGETMTGVSLMRMDEQIDHGPVYATAEILIMNNDDYRSLEEKLGQQAANLLENNLEGIADGRIAAAPQRHEDATFTALIEKKDGFVSWKKTSAEIILRMLRAFEPWPGVYAVWNRKNRPLRLKIMRAEVADDLPARVPGEAASSPDGFPTIQTESGSIRLIEVQPEGKKSMRGDAFMRGYPDFVGAILENSEDRNEKK